MGKLREGTFPGLSCVQAAERSALLVLSLMSVALDHCQTTVRPQGNLVPSTLKTGLLSLQTNHPGGWASDKSPWVILARLRTRLAQKPKNLAIPLQVVTHPFLEGFVLESQVSETGVVRGLWR